MSSTLLAEKLGLTWFDWQAEAFALWEGLAGPAKRLCLYYRTGGGKTLTALACLAQDGHDHALVVCPPATFDMWAETAAKLGMSVETVSHAKFRQQSYLVSRKTPVIADEFHLFGGNQGIGWKKLDRLSRSLDAPMILCSATPNYNDAERCYCIKHILEPDTTVGGFLAFIYEHCTTKQNPFGLTPAVTGFHKYGSAAGFLAALPGVAFLPDTVDYTVVDVPYPERVPDEFDEYGLNRREGRIIASQIEGKHQRRYHNLIDEDGQLRQEVYDLLIPIVGDATTPVLVFSNSSVVANAMAKACAAHDVVYDLITGKTNRPQKLEILDAFRRGELDVLIGTASLATGPDGLDKVCNTLIILDDTEDAALRRQLLGRILPRGLNVDASMKQFIRLVPDAA